MSRWWGNHPAELRWQLELYRLLADPVFRGRGVPRGDGRPVLLMPGFGAGDYALVVLARWLGRIGYAPFTAGFVTNTGCSDRAIGRPDQVSHAVSIAANLRRQLWISVPTQGAVALARRLRRTQVPGCLTGECT